MPGASRVVPRIRVPGGTKIRNGEIRNRKLEMRKMKWKWSSVLYQFVMNEPGAFGRLTSGVTHTRETESSPCLWDSWRKEERKCRLRDGVAESEQEREARLNKACQARSVTSGTEEWFREPRILSECPSKPQIEHRHILKIKDKRISKTQSEPLETVFG